MQAANVADSLNRLALRGKMLSEEAADAAAAGEAALASQRALGQVMPFWRESSYLWEFRRPHEYL